MLLSNRLFMLVSSFVVVTSLLMGPSVALAHEEGVSYEEVIGGHRVDIGYDPKDLVANGEMNLDFGLFDTNTGYVEPFDSVWVRIDGDGTTYLATAVARAHVGKTTLLMRLPASMPAVLQIRARFERAGNPQAEATLKLTGIHSSTPRWIEIGAWHMAFGVLVVLGYELVRRTIGAKATDAIYRITQ